MNMDPLTALEFYQNFSFLKNNKHITIMACRNECMSMTSLVIQQV